jgi:hypothetical protein
MLLAKLSILKKCSEQNYVAIALDFQSDSVFFEFKNSLKENSFLLIGHEMLVYITENLKIYAYRNGCFHFYSTKLKKEIEIISQLIQVLKPSLGYFEII